MTRLATWKAQYDDTARSQAADSTALKAYRAKMQEQLRAYSTLRGDLSDWISRVESPSAYVTYQDAFDELSHAQWDRQAVRDAMNRLAVPPSLQGMHGQLVQVVDDAIAAVQSAYDGMDDSDNCRSSCSYKHMAGWRQFVAESSRITDSYRRAESAWQGAVASLAAEIDARVLPTRPVV